MREPQIFAEGFTSDEIYLWMASNAQGAAQLQGALAERECLRQELEKIEQRISELTSSSAVVVVNKAQDPTPDQQPDQTLVGHDGHSNF